MQEEHIMKELDDFLASWEATAEGNRAAFLALKEHLKGLDAVLNCFGKDNAGRCI